MDIIDVCWCLRCVSASVQDKSTRMVDIEAWARITEGIREPTSNPTGPGPAGDHRPLTDDSKFVVVRDRR